MARYDDIEYDIKHVELWSSEQSHGQVLHDPVSGDQLDPGMPPDWMLKNRRLSEGLSYLQHGLGEATIFMMYTAGEKSEDDLDAVDQEVPTLEEALNGDVGIQAVMHTVDRVQVADNGLMVLSAEAQNNYTDRLSHAAAIADSVLICAGVAVDDRYRPLTGTERTLRKIAAAAEAAAFDPEYRGDPAEIIRASALDSHQWYRVLSGVEQIMQRRVQFDARGPINNIVVAAPNIDAAYTAKITEAGGQNGPDVAEYMLDPAGYTALMAGRTATIVNGYMKWL